MPGTGAPQPSTGASMAPVDGGPLQARAPAAAPT